MKSFRPKFINGLCGRLLVILVLASCSGEPSKKYSVNVEYLSFGQGETNSEESEELEPEEINNYSAATISIKRVDVSDSNEEILSELLTSSFRNGEVVLNGQIENPMWIKVLVASEEASETLIETTLVEPGEKVSLAVVDYKHRYWTDKIAHVGSLTDVLDTNKQFTLSADLSSASAQLLNGIADLYARTWNERGARLWQSIGSIVVKEGTFHIELEIEHPLVVEVGIEGMESGYAFATLIAEPGGTVFLKPSRRTAYASANLATGWFESSQDADQRREGLELVALAGSGRHARLIESWKRSYTYQLKNQQKNDALEEYRAQQEAKIAMRTHLEEVDDSESEEPTTQNMGSSAKKFELADGCKHVDLSQVRPDRRTLERIPYGTKHQQLVNELDQIELSRLNEIALRATDPFDSLLALELGALNSAQQREVAMKTFEVIALNVPADVAEKRVEPARDFLVAVMESEQNEHNTAPGQVAPDFRLPNVEGTTVTLHQILNKNDLVYVTFDFVRDPEFYYLSDQLRLLFQTYHGEGLQIVEVLFVEEPEEWRDHVAIQDVGWIQLLESQSLVRSDVARALAMVHSWKNYLIDSKGCIIQRNLQMEVIEDFLVAYFDTSTSTQ